MSSQIFAKFQYQDKIKKVALSLSDLTWDNISNIISRSFSISPSRIKLTYKDPEGDEITACCDQDLLEAQRASPKQQPLRFFIYKASLNHQKSMPTEDSVLKKSRISAEDPNPLNTSVKTQPKSKSLTSIKDPSPEKKESLILSQDSLDSENPEGSQVKEMKLNTNDIKSLLKTLFQTNEAKNAIQTLKLNIGDSSSISASMDLDSKEFQQLFLESLTTALNEPLKDVQLPIIEEIQPAEIDLKSTIMSRGSYEEEEEQKEERAKVNNDKLDFEKSLLDSTLKETIYEKSQNENNLLRRTLDKNQMSMRNKSLSSSICCKDLTSSYGVKLALQYENGRMRLLSIPSGEYTIIDSIGASSKGENRNTAAQIKKSSTVDVLPRLT